MNPDETELREAARELAEALGTMLNLIKADALPATPEAHGLIREAMALLDEPTGAEADADALGETLARATALNRLITSAREQILDDALAASPVPDHPPL